MKNEITTRQIIDLLCVAVSGLDVQMTVWKKFKAENDVAEMDDSEIYEKLGERPHGLFAYSAEMCRELFRLLPEALQDTDEDKVLSDLYRHLYEEGGYDGLKPLVNKAHSFAYGLWSDMDQARSKYGLS